MRKVREDYLPRRRVTIYVYGYTEDAVADPDNLLKIVLDALKRARLIVDDSLEWLECPIPVIELAEKGTESYTTFTIEDI